MFGVGEANGVKDTAGVDIGVGLPIGDAVACRVPVGLGSGDGAGIRVGDMVGVGVTVVRGILVVTITFPWGRDGCLDASAAYSFASS